MTALGNVEQLSEEGLKLVDVGCLPADPVLNQPEGVLQFFWSDSHCHLDSIKPETQPGHSPSWRGGLVGCLLKAEVLQQGLQYVEMKSVHIMIASYGSKIINVVQHCASLLPEGTCDERRSILATSSCPS